LYFLHTEVLEFKRFVTDAFLLRRYLTLDGIVSCGE
jgi:hypothetical protein